MSIFNTKIIPEDQIIYVYDLIKNIIAPGNRAFVSPFVQNKIDEVLDEGLPDNWREDENFIKSLNSQFQSKKFSTYDEEYLPAFYAAYYLPNNFYKIQIMILELFRLGKISFSEKEIKILDIGACVGTTAWAIYDFYEILVHVLKLYNLKVKKLPKLVVDNLEISKMNIDFFNIIREKFSDTSKNVKINKPIQGDITKGGLEKIRIKGYDIIFMSNVINELPSYEVQKETVLKLINKMNKNANFILIETAMLEHTCNLKKIQHELTQKKNINVLSPCGKINGFSQRCKNCWSFRKENLNIPDTMKVISKYIDESDDNEKLKWSYTIFSKGKNEITNNKNGEFIPLSDIPNYLDKNVSVIAEIVSGKIQKEQDKKNFYLKICDQSEKKEHVILKVPKYYELPNHEFGDVFEIKVANVEKIVWKKPGSVNYALAINPQQTIVKNRDQLSEKRGLVSFNNVEEDNLQFFLKRFFNFDEFYEGQFELVKKALKNENVLGILATGGGKSLSFQLPALLKPGVSIVISPLKSLMDDQVYGLRNRFGLDFVDRIHSGMDYKNKQKALNRFKQGYLKILYIAPERLQQKSFQKELTNLIHRGININYFPIDEAHCISEWGHDFRPSYARLKERQNELSHIDGNNPPLIALTATASRKVRDDVMNQLKMDPKQDLIHKIIDRKELSLEVINLKLSPKEGNYSIKYRDPDNNGSFLHKEFEPGTHRYEILLYVINKILPKRFTSFDIHSDAGLIFTTYADPLPCDYKVKEKLEKKCSGSDTKPSYSSDEYKDILNQLINTDSCREREGANWISQFLNNNGIESRAWFSELGYRPDRKRKKKKKLRKRWEIEKVKIQDDFIKNKLNLLVSTKGFGMGIDKPNIRFIIHFGFPGSLEEYFQQIGRAGRDRNHSHCILFWDGPTKECKQNLEKNIGKKAFPNCYEANENTNRIDYKECRYGRNKKCDFAKQVFFIESGYPTIRELKKSIDYLVNKGKDSNTFPWVYIKKNYLKDSLVLKGKDRYRVKEKLIVESLYTLKYIEYFSQTYLSVKIKRSSSWKEIYESTNNDIIREQINLISKVYSKDYPDILRIIPKKFIKFDIHKHVQAVRLKFNQSIQVEEFLGFLNLLNNRVDVKLRFDYRSDYGYEIKLNRKVIKKNIEESEDLKLVTEWKKSQYEMLNNIVNYAQLKPFGSSNKEETKCRRVKIMQIFGTKGASDTIKCNFCDNCGFKNSWKKQANEIDADIDEQIFIEKLRDFYLEQTKNSEYLKKAIKDFISLTDEMLENDYLSLAETISKSWLEQIGESENSSTNLMLSIINYRKNEAHGFNARFKIFLQSNINQFELIQTILEYMKNTFDFDMNSLYEENFRSNKIDEMKINLQIFNSDKSKIFSNIETEIGLNIADKQNKKLSKIYSKQNYGGSNG